RGAARPGGAVGPAGVAARPPAYLARTVRCRRRQVGRRRARLVGPDRKPAALGLHPAGLPLPTPAAGLETTAQRTVRVGRRTRRVRRLAPQGDPPGRNPDDAPG